MKSVLGKLAVVTMLSVPLLGSAVADEAAEHPLSFMFGEWVGPSSSYTKAKVFEGTQTERVGPMQDGDIVVIEGRGYGADGDIEFYTFSAVSPTAKDGGWEIHLYRDGQAGTYPFEITETGYVWSLPASSGGRVVFTGIFEGNTWRQLGVNTPVEGPARQTVEMILTRTADTDWPAGNPVSPQLD